MATYADFLAQIRRDLEEPVAGVWADASIMYWTNSVSADFARKTKLFRDSISISAVVDQYIYTLSAYTLEPIGVFYENTELVRTELASWPPQESTTGTPRKYAVDGVSMYVWPIPDATGDITLFYYRIPEPITAGTDTMPFQSMYDATLEYGVLAKAFEQTGDWQSAGEYMARYNQGVLDAQNQGSMQRQARRSVNPVEVY